MFTGIIQDIGTVRAVHETEGGLRLGIETGMNLEKVAIGASVACAGCCLTVISKEKNILFTDVSAETLTKSSIGSWRPGTKVNLEPSLSLGDPLDGHFVFGHLDAAAKLEDIKPDGSSRRMIFSVPDHLAKFIAPKGSVALDGVSLTVNETDSSRFGVNIIPHTLAHTTLGLNKSGDLLNIEIDMLARYVARALNKDAA